MRTVTEIDQEIAHIVYGRAMLDARRRFLKALGSSRYADDIVSTNGRRRTAAARRPYLGPEGAALSGARMTWRAPRPA